MYQLQLPKEELEVLWACWWAKSLTAQRQEPVAEYGCQGPAESPSTEGSEQIQNLQEGIRLLRGTGSSLWQ